MGEAENNGHGGCTSYGSLQTESAKLIMEKAEAYAKSLPPIVTDLMDGDKPFSYPSNLEAIIGNLVAEEDQKKIMASFEKKKQKEMLTKIIVGNPKNPGQYRAFNFAKGITVASILAQANGEAHIRKIVSKIILQEGEEILNTNLGLELQTA